MVGLNQSRNVGVQCTYPAMGPKQKHIQNFQSQFPGEHSVIIEDPARPCIVRYFVMGLRGTHLNRIQGPVRPSSVTGSSSERARFWLQTWSQLKTLARTS